MNNTIKNLFIFTVGAAIGSVVTCKLLREQYEQMAQEEIDSVKEVFSRDREIKAENSDEDTDEADDEVEIKEQKKTAEAIIKEMRYSIKEDEDQVENEDIYVIPPNEFGDEVDYDVVSLTYYSDGVLTDEMDNPIEDPEAIIGPKALDSFGEYEDDSVFVRNDDQECYYEILKDNRTYAEVVSEDE